MKEFQAIHSNPDQNSKKPLVVLLHGYGSNMQDMAGLIPQLPQNLDYISAQAPLPMPHGGFTWFNVQADDKGRLEFSGHDEDAKQVVAELHEWIQEQAKGRPSVSLAGFSMGMIMDTSMMRTYPTAYKCVAGMSGFVIDRPFPGDEELKEHKIPFFWGRDQYDTVIEQQYIDFTAPWLQEHTELQKVVYPNISHSISPQEIKHLGEFLERYAS